MLPRESSVSWMDNKPLYSHLDRERCVWEFSKWLPVEDWLEQCGGSRQQHGESHTATSSINVTVHSAYIQHDYHLAAYTLTGTQPAIVAQISNFTDRAVFLPPPMHMLPENRDSSDARIFPIAVQPSSSESGSTVLQVYFYSLLSLRADRKTYTADIANSSSSPPALLHTDTTGNTSRQIWLWEFVGAKLPTTIPVVFYPTSDQVPLCEADCAVDGGDGALRFSLPVASDSGSLYRPTLRATVTVQHDPDIVSNQTEPFTLGKKCNSTQTMLWLVGITLLWLAVN